MDDAQSRANDVEALSAPVERNAVFRPPSEMDPEELRQLTEFDRRGVENAYMIRKFPRISTN